MLKIPAAAVKWYQILHWVWCRISKQRKFFGKNHPQKSLKTKNVYHNQQIKFKIHNCHKNELFSKIIKHQVLKSIAAWASLNAKKKTKIQSCLNTNLRLKRKKIRKFCLFFQWKKKPFFLKWSWFFRISSNLLLWETDKI